MVSPTQTFEEVWAEIESYIVDFIRPGTLLDWYLNGLISKREYYHRASHNGPDPISCIDPKHWWMHPLREEANANS